MTTWQEVEKNWTTFKPKFRAHWPKLTELQVNKIEGHRDVLSRSLETDYKITHKEAENQIDSFLKTLEPVK